MSFFEELKRRNVVRVGIAYAVSSWIILQLTDVIGEILELPEWGGKIILLMLGVGFLLALFLAWAYELTPEGVKREADVNREQSITRGTGRKLDFAIIGLLVVALGYFIWESRFSSPGVSQEANIASPGAQTTATSPAGQSTTAATAGKQSIAVLPFTNRSPDPNDAYFTDGVHDDLLTQLAKLNAFSVISRTSVLEYRDTAKNLKEIAAELGVANVMEGAVQRAGSRVRINVQLIDAVSDEHLWAEVYDRELSTENLFDIQSEIAVAIAGALQATLTDTEIANVAEAPTDNVHAYELYLQARGFALGSSVLDYQSALDLYQEALELDPQFKLAWLGLAEAHINQYWLAGGKTADRQAARDAIDQARALDSDFPELYMAEGFYWYWGFLDYDRALENIDRALQLMPGSAEAHMWHGWISRRAGRWYEAIASMQESTRLNPRQFFNLTELATTQLYTGQFEAAAKSLAQAEKVNPADYWVKTTRAHWYIRQSGDLTSAKRLTLGSQFTPDFNHVLSHINIRLLAEDYDEALVVAKNWSTDLEIQRSLIMLREDWVAQVLFLSGETTAAREQAGMALERLQAMALEQGDDYRIKIASARLHAILGNTDRVAELIKQARATEPRDALAEAVNRYSYVRIYALAGMNEQALEGLGKAIECPAGCNANWARLDPALKSLHDDPRFIELVGQP